MAKKEAYFWRGKKGRGELKIDRLYKVGEKIPHEKMDEGTFAKMVKDGRIQKTAFDIDDSPAVSDLEKKVKQLSKQIVELNKSDDKARITELEGEVAKLEESATGDNPLQGELDTANEKVAELEGEVAKLEESATGDNPLQGELDTANEKVAELEGKVTVLKEAAKDDK